MYTLNLYVHSLAVDFLNKPFTFICFLIRQPLPYMAVWEKHNPGSVIQANLIKLSHLCIIICDHLI